MPRYIIRLSERYAVWSTLADAPVSSFVPHLEDLATHQALRSGVSAGALSLLWNYGTTHPGGCFAEDLIAGNRAGEGETCLSAEELLVQYAAQSAE